MADFFKTIYDHAVETGTLNYEDDQKYCIALAEFDELAENLIPDTDDLNKLLRAVYDLFYCSDLSALSYGFRLGMRVTASDRQ